MHLLFIMTWKVSDEFIVVKREVSDRVCKIKCPLIRCVGQVLSKT